MKTRHRPESQTKPLKAKSMPVFRPQNCGSYQSAIGNWKSAIHSIRHSAFDRCHMMTLPKKLYLQNEPI